MVPKNGEVSEGTSGSEKVASVAPIVMRYPYHCVPSRMDGMEDVLSGVLSGLVACSKVRNLGCVLSPRK